MQRIIELERIVEIIERRDTVVTHLVVTLLRILVRENLPVRRDVHDDMVAVVIREHLRDHRARRAVVVLDEWALIDIARVPPAIADRERIEHVAFSHLVRRCVLHGECTLDKLVAVLLSRPFYRVILLCLLRLLHLLHRVLRYVSRRLCLLLRTAQEPRL